MEFDVTVNKEILNEIKEYMENSLISDMKYEDLSFEAMAVILTAIANECDRVERLLEE